MMNIEGGGGGGVTLPIAESDVTNLVTDLAAKVDTTTDQSVGGSKTFTRTPTFTDSTGDGRQIFLHGTGTDASRIQFLMSDGSTARAYVGYGSASGQTFRIACNNASAVLILETGGNEIIKTDGTYLQFQVVPTFNAGNTTGAGSAALGANCPAVTPTAPNKWITVTLADGSTAYIPAWK